MISILMMIFLLIVLTSYTFVEYDIKNHVLSKNKKFSFQVTDWQVERIQKISLIDTANLVALEEDVIAPGTKGDFEIELDARNSNVDVRYSIEAKESKNRPVNLLFRVNADGKEYTSLQELAKQELTGIITKEERTQTKKFTIFWEWPYETGNTEEKIEEADKQDTKSGTGTGLKQENEFDYSFSLKVIGKQA